jgi:hypothetical protein
LERFVTDPLPPEPGSVNKIFGVEIPKESSDERDPDDTRDELDRDRWLRDNVPPHHL